MGRRPEWLLQESSPNSLVSLFSLFLFEKFFLLKPATLYKEGPVLSHRPPLQLDWGLSRLGPLKAGLHSLCECSPPLCVCYFVLIPLPATSSNQVSPGAAQTLFGRGWSCWPGSLPRVLQQTRQVLGLWLQPPWSPHWSQGPYCPEALSLPFDFSMSSEIFGLLSSYMLGYCWLFTLFLGRSARCFTRVQGGVESAPTYLTANLALPCSTFYPKENER